MTPQRVNELYDSLFGLGTLIRSYDSFGREWTLFCESIANDPLETESICKKLNMLRTEYEYHNLIITEYKKEQFNNEFLEKLK